jgi:hypothetical protein
MRCIAQLGLMTVLGEVADFATVVAWITGRCKLLWWPDCHLLLLLLLYWQSAIVLLLLLWAVSLELWRRAARLSCGWGLDHAVLRGALLELPPEGPDTALFLFFSSGTSQAFMVTSWSMVALASSLYDKFCERIKQSYN